MKESTIQFVGVAMILLCIASTCIAQDCKGKQQWPELVGVDGKIAAQIIERENPLVKAVILDQNAIVLPYVDCKRVRVFVSKISGTVVRIPTVG